MNRIVGVLVLLVVATLSAQPARAEGPPRVEVLFVLDSTGSMGSVIAEAKKKILEIGAAIAEGEPRPDVRFGILTYRDRGDEYVTKRWRLDPDWSKTQGALASIKADGGGDTPESVIQALHEGIRETSWSLTPDVMKIVYLIGDAPPKRYDDDPDYRADLAWAVQNGIVIHAIGCPGLRGSDQAFFEEVALDSEGRYYPLAGAAAAARLGGGVREVEADAAARSPRPADLATVVSRSARAYSSERGVHYDPASAGAISLTPLESGGATTSPSGLLGEHVRLIRDARSFRMLWAAHHSLAATGPAGGLPTVDFHRDALLAVSLSAGAVGTVEAWDADGVLTVRVQRTETGPRVALLRLPATDDTLRFEIVGGEK